MRYLSLFSGIEAASVAWKPLGWDAAAFSEIEPFPCSVLAHHYPDVPNLGDVTKFKEWPDLGPVDLICGGSPCQSFSVAGLRKGMDDPRGNLALVYLAIVNRYRPRWVVYENVPGLLSSNGGRDFGSFLGGLVELGYGFAYRVLDAQYVRVDGFGRAVPQRRRRVFVVGYLGDWRRAAAVLFEREGMRWDSAPSRKSGEGIAGTIDASAARSRGAGVNPGTITSTGSVPHCLNAGGMGRQDFETETMVAHAIAETLTSNGDAHSGFREAAGLVAHSLRGEGFDASEDGTGRGTPIVPIAFDTTQITSKANVSNPKAGDPCHPLAAGAHPPAIAIQAGALRENPNSGPDGAGVQDGIAYTLEARAEVQAVQAAWAVRRLIPVECERLQGFDDNFTAIPHRGKPAADGPRYKALGNSMAVNAMRWIGRRIEMVEQMTKDLAA